MTLDLKTLSKQGGREPHAAEEEQLFEMEQSSEEKSVAPAVGMDAPEESLDDIVAAIQDGGAIEPPVIAELDEEAEDKDDELDLSDILASMNLKLDSSLQLSKDANATAQAALEAATQPRPDAGAAKFAQTTAVAPASSIDAAANAIGGAIGKVASAPLIGLSAAARHFTQSVRNSARVAPSMAPASTGVPGSSLQSNVLTPELFNTMEMLTSEKCDRIVKAAREVTGKAGALRMVPEYAFFDEALTEAQSVTGKSRNQLLREMGHDAELRDLKLAADTLWERNGDLVAEYRDRCDKFARAIRTSEKKYASRNTENETRSRVNEAMEQVANQTADIPGFGEQFGEYGLSMADRVMELVKRLAQLFNDLHAKVFGRPMQDRRAAGNDPSP